MFEFPISLIIFLCFFFFITIFGFFILSLFDRKLKLQNLTLVIILKSFGIGLAIYFPYSMFITGLRIFNFFSAYLPLILFDIAYIIIVTVQNRKKIDPKNLTNIKDKFLGILYQNRHYILILITAFLMQYFLQLYFINWYISYPSSDPYYWFQNVWSLSKEGYFDYDFLGGHFPGFVILCSGSLSITTDFYAIYYYIKFLPAFLMSINILVVYVLSRNIFDKKIYIFFTLSVFLGFDYMFYRYNMALPSTLATTFGYIFLLFILQSTQKRDASKRNKFKAILCNQTSIYKALILSVILMAHPLYFLFFGSFYFLYEIYLMILQLLKDNQLKKSEIILQCLLKLISIFIYLIVIMIPFLVITYLYVGNTLFGSYIFYFPSLLIQRNLLLLSTIILSFGNIENAFSIWSGLVIEFVMIFILLGIFLKYEKAFHLNKQQNQFVIFIKGSYIFSYYFVFFVIQIMLVSPMPFLNDLANFINSYSMRLVEIFSGLWAIILVLAFGQIIYYINKNKNENKKTENNPLEKSQFIAIIIIGLIFYTANYSSVYYNNHFRNNEQTLGILYMANYFNEHPIQDETNILLESLELHIIYNLIRYDHLEKFYYNCSVLNYNYTDFKNYYDNNTCTYVFLSFTSFTASFELNFSQDFSYIYKNTEFVFASSI